MLLVLRVRNQLWLSLLRDARVQYHACEMTSSIEVATSSNTIQVAPGVAMIIRCVDGHVQIETTVQISVHGKGVR